MRTVTNLLKYLIPLFLVVVLLALPAATLAAPVETATGTYYVSADIGLNVRSQPNTASAVVTGKPCGAQVEVLDWSGDWAKVANGYMFGGYLDQNKPSCTKTNTLVYQTINSTTVCTKHGTLAWHADNLLSGAQYGEAPVGGLDEPCGVVGQTWTTNGPERFVFYVPAYSVAWLSGHNGGTGWYWDPRIDPNADLNKQATELEKRDGRMKTTVANLTLQSFRLVNRFQTGVARSVPAFIPTVGASSTMTGTAGTCNANDAIGPAILEYGEPGTNKPTVVKLGSGKTSSLYNGGCFAFPSQAALDARWTDHKAEFLAKYANGQAIEPAGTTAAPAASAASTAVSGAGKCNTADAIGPAILEYGEPGSNKPTVVKLNSGKTSTLNNGGCFAFPSQAALDARWTDHKSEFLAKYANGQALEK